MENDEAFLQAITQDPSDDNVRLVYADWLEERGDRRAEFLRVQCTINQHSGSTSAYKELLAHERHLAGLFDRTWVQCVSRFSFGWIRTIFFQRSKYPPRTTAKELDAAEKELGMRFPASYRAFARRCGLGGRLHTLPELFPLTPLAGGDEGAWWDSVIGATRFHRSAEAIPIGPEKFLEHAVIFGIDEGEHTFAFHTGEITNPILAECRIYDIPRHGDPVPISDSFESWLRWIDSQYRLDHDSAEEEQNKEQFGLEFLPDSTDDNPMPYWRHAL